MSHKHKPAPGPVPPANRPHAGPQGHTTEHPGGGELPGGNGISEQEQDPQRRIGDYEQKGEHSIQEPGGRAAGR